MIGGAAPSRRGPRGAGVTWGSGSQDATQSFDRLNLTAPETLGVPGEGSEGSGAQNGAPGRFGCSRCGKRWNGYKIEHCASCCESFSTTHAGDMHRTGEHGVHEGPDRRRCRTVDEMLALRTKAGKPRMKLNQRGVWTLWSDRAWRGGDR